MDKMERDEKLWGSIFGIVAILAAIVEMCINGIDAGSIAGAIKDIAGTAVVFVVLAAFINNLPKKPKNLVDILEKNVEDWGSDNAPLIFKTEGYVAAQNSAYTQGFVLLQNPKSYISLANNKLDKDHPEWKKYAQYGNGKLTGKFLDLPSYEAMLNADFDIMVVMEQSHFKNMPEIDDVIKEIVNAVNVRDGSKFRAERVGKANKIRFSCGKIASIQDVEEFVDMLDFVLSFVKIIV